MTYIMHIIIQHTDQKLSQNTPNMPPFPHLSTKGWTINDLGGGGGPRIRYVFFPGPPVDEFFSSLEGL